MVNLAFDPAAAATHLDALGAAHAGIRARAVDLDGQMRGLSSAWSGAAQTAHGDAHADWATRMTGAHDDGAALLQGAHAAAARLALAEQDATAIWL